MSPLIEITDPKLFNPEIILIDARGGADAYQRYLAGHLSNAVFASLDDDLAGHPVDPAFGGRHPLPPLTDFAKTLSKWGITPDSHIVVYDDKSGANSASRLWWMLRSIGHKQVQVLNGGLQAAINEGIRLSTEDHRPVPAATYPIPETYNGIVDIEEAGQAAQKDDMVLIDVREAPRYLGQTEPLDLIAGHIPGADNLPYFHNLDADGKYRPADELADLYKQTIGDIKPENVVVHCGSGVTACHTLLGMAHAGITEPKLYVGSWSEWSRRDLPVAKEEK